MKQHKKCGVTLEIIKVLFVLFCFWSWKWPCLIHWKPITLLLTFSLCRMAVNWHKPMCVQTERAVMSTLSPAVYLASLTSTRFWFRGVEQVCILHTPAPPPHSWDYSNSKQQLSKPVYSQRRRIIQLFTITSVPPCKTL